MPRPSIPTLRALAGAAMLLAACDGRNEAVAPETDPLIAIHEASLRPNPNAQHAIMDLVDAVTAAWTAKDAAAYAAPYAVDIQLVNPRGAALAGRDAFQAQHVILFSGPFAGSTQTILVKDIQFLTGTIAIVYQEVSLTGYAFLPPGLPSLNGVVRNRVTWVVMKREGKWEIVFQQMTPIL